MLPIWLFLYGGDFSTADIPFLKTLCYFRSIAARIAVFMIFFYLDDTDIVIDFGTGDAYIYFSIFTSFVVFLERTLIQVTVMLTLRFSDFFRDSYAVRRMFRCRFRDLCVNFSPG